MSAFSMDRVSCVFVFCVFVYTARGQSFRVVDLTHEQSASTIYWPGDPEYNFTILERKQYPNYWFENNFFCTPEHAGTHLDAPAHFSKGKERTAQIPMDKLVGPGVIIDVKEKARSNPDYQVTIQDLQDWESQYGRIPNGAAVIMNSGWHEKYPNKTEVFTSATPDNASTFHFPAWHKNATQWLVDNRKPHMVGVDTPSTDYGQSKTYPNHVILGGNSIPGLENVANLDAIPPKGSIVFAAVFKLYDGSGGPVRIFATVGDLHPTSKCSISMSSIVLLVSIFSLFIFVM